MKPLINLGENVNAITIAKTGKIDIHLHPI